MPGGVGPFGGQAGFGFNEITIRGIAIDSLNADALGKASRTAIDLGEAMTDAAKQKEIFRKGERYARLAVRTDSSSGAYAQQMIEPSNPLDWMATTALSRNPASACNAASISPSSMR